MAAPIYILTNEAWGFPFLHTRPAFTLRRFFEAGDSDLCEVTPHCHFDCIFLIISDVEHLFIHVLAIRRWSKWEENWKKRGYMCVCVCVCVYIYIWFTLKHCKKLIQNCKATIVFSRPVMSDSLQPHGACQASLSMRFSRQEHKNTGVDFHFLLRGFFLTQGLNTSLLHCKWILYH